MRAVLPSKELTTFLGAGGGAGIGMSSDAKYRRARSDDGPANSEMVNAVIPASLTAIAGRPHETVELFAMSSSVVELGLESRCVVMAAPTVSAARCGWW
jgi:hypothetical protein